jgi:hypothetical protein
MAPDKTDICRWTSVRLSQLTQRDVLRGPFADTANGA